MLETLARAIRPPEAADVARPSVGSLVALFALFAAGYACLGRWGLGAFPFSGDEYSYALQADIFARGRLAMPPPAHPEIFQLDQVLVGPMLRSKYPPGWPLILALGAFVHAPWLVNPVLGALTLALVYAVCGRLHGPGPALAATLLLGFSPFFAFNAASLHSHPSSLLALIAFAACLVAGWDRRSTGWALLGGAALGFAALNRQLDALLYGVALVLLLPQRVRYVSTCAICAVAVSSLLLVYQAVQFGSPLTTGYALYQPALRALYGDTNASPLTLAHLVDLAGQWCHVQWLGDLAYWLAPGLIVMAAIGLAWGSPGPARTLARVVVAAQLAVMLFYGHDAGPSYGPRYLFSLLGPIALGAAAAWSPSWHWIVSRGPSDAGGRFRVERRIAAVLMLVLAGGVLRGGFLLDRHRDQLRHWTRLYESVSGQRLSNAVVIVKGTFPERWTRNGPTFDRPVLYVAPREDDETIARFFPTRSIYVASRTHETDDWRIERFR